MTRCDNDVTQFSVETRIKPDLVVDGGGDMTYEVLKNCDPIAVGTEKTSLRAGCKVLFCRLREAVWDNTCVDLVTY